jgi:hypothetical protein
MPSCPRLLQSRSHVRKRDPQAMHLPRAHGHLVLLVTFSLAPWLPGSLAPTRLLPVAKPFSIWYHRLILFLGE